VVHDAGALDDLPEGAVHVTRLGKHEIGLIRRGSRVFAVHNRCPHQAAPLCAGALRPRIDSSGVGSIQHDADRPVLACPWHGWEFDIETGRSTWSDAYRVKTFAARVENGRVLVETGGSPNA
jgi:nitrite reductase (NADH) small subunit